MNYSHSSKHRKTCRHDPDHRAQLGYRLRTARLTLGWSSPDAAKYFQVTDRTWHNWESGTHRIPLAVYKLCRVLARLELPGDAWAGWHFQAGNLITPEGRTIRPQDGSWWSLLVRQALGFGTAYREACRLRVLLSQQTELSGESGEAAGLVPYKTTHKSVLNLSDNQEVISKPYQNDGIIVSWPPLCDLPPALTHLHAPSVKPSESPLMPLCVLPSMPTCASRLSPHLTVHATPSQSLSTLPQPPGKTLISPALSPSPANSVGRKNKPCTKRTKQSSSASPDNNPSARPAQGAQPPKLASAATGTP